MLLLPAKAVGQLLFASSSLSYMGKVGTGRMLATQQDWQLNRCCDLHSYTALSYPKLATTDLVLQLATSALHTKQQNILNVKKDDRAPADTKPRSMRFNGTGPITSL